MKPTGLVWFGLFFYLTQCDYCKETCKAPQWKILKTLETSSPYQNVHSVNLCKHKKKYLKMCLAVTDLVLICY